MHDRKIVPSDPHAPTDIRKVTLFPREERARDFAPHSNPHAVMPMSKLPTSRCAHPRLGFQPLLAAARLGLLLLVALASSMPAPAASSVLRTWDDLDVGTPVDHDKRSATTFVEGAEIAEDANFGACSGTRFLRKRAPAPGKDGTPAADPGPLTLVFDRPQSYVGMCVGNPDGKLPRDVVAYGYGPGDATKPVATVRVTLPPGTPLSYPISLCRLLEHDLARVELSYGDDAVEHLDNLRVDAVDGTTSRITFEEHPVGTLLETQFSGVRFATRPEIVTSTTLGIGTSSEPQALRQRVAGESDPGAMILEFDPPQGAIRISTGYPPGEKVDGPLRVYLRAFAPSAKGFVEVASDGIELHDPVALRRTLEVCRLDADITRVEIRFASPFAGYEAIDDLQFGPRAPAANPDAGAPRIVVDHPADGTVFPQPSSRPEHAWLALALRGRIEEDRALNSFRVQVLDEAGGVRWDDGERLGAVQGSAPNFTFDIPIRLEYGASVVRLAATDAAGNLTTTDHRLSYLGPPPVSVSGTVPQVAYPPIVFRNATPTTPAIANPPTVVRIQGRGFHAETRFYLVAESRATLPPSAPDLIEVPPSVRSPAGDFVEVPVPDAVFRAPGRYVWLVWDLWTRPGFVDWTRAGILDARAWPLPALWSIGFRNRDETNDVGDFEGVYGEDVLGGFLEPETPIDGCDRGVNAINFFLGRYLPTLNSPGAGGSCFGFAAASQLFAAGIWRADGFDPAAQLPSGFLAPAPMRFTTTDCAPQAPANLWAHIQTLFGIHTSYEFLSVWADQTDTVSDGTMRGNPVAVADRIRANPGGYVLGFTPFNRNVGHAVAPYRVENRDADTIRIWVLDSNAPYDPAQPEESLVNRQAVNRFIDIDRRSNAYRFSLGATADPALEYQTTNFMRGSALVAVPLSVFQNPRTIPWSDYLAEQYFGITGDVEAELEIEGAGSWGWDEQGEFHGSLAGLSIVPSFNGGDAAASNPLVLVPTNHARVALNLGGKDPHHHLLVANGGVILGARRGDRAADRKDAYLLLAEAGRPSALRFQPGSPAAAWQPELGLLEPGLGELHYRLLGLELDAGEALTLAALPDERGARIRHDGAKPVQFQVELAGAAARSGRDRQWFGPFVLAPGAILDLVPVRWPDIAVVEARLDLDGDGQPDSIAPSPGRAVALKPGDLGDCNRNGLLDAYDIATGTSTDANDDGLPDDCASGGQGGNTGGGGGGGTASCPPDGDQELSFANLPDGPVAPEGLGIVHVASEAGIRGGVLTLPPAPAPGGAHPDTLTLRFACPRGTVALGAVNTSKTGSVRARAWAFNAADASKPVAQAEALLPADPTLATPLVLCRPLDEDILTVVLEFEGAPPEAIRFVGHGTRVAHQVQRLDFEDRPAGTVVFGHYAGITFPERPVVTLASALGVGTSSPTRVLRKTPSDSDPGPLTLRFDPPQAEVRLRVGYPSSENDGRPLRVALRAYDGTKGNPAPVAADELVIASPRALDRVLRVARCAADIHEVRVQFLDRRGGLEAIDDLEFGPIPVGTSEPDTVAPVVRLVSPDADTSIAQADPAQTTSGTNLVAEITENRALDHVRVVVRDAAGTILQTLDDSNVRLTGSAPRFRLEATIALAYGHNGVSVEAVDTSGNVGTTAAPRVIQYRGPVPVALTEATPAVGYPDDLIKDGYESPLGQIEPRRLPTTTFTLRGAGLHRLVRVHAIPFDQARTPPDPAHLIPAEIVSRNNAGTELQVRLPSDAWRGANPATDRALRWIVEDSWTRPDRVPWTLGAAFVARYRPWPMTWGFGFVNIEGPNDLTDFDGVFGRSAYLWWSDYCWRDPVYLGFYEWGYRRTLNQSPGGSCYGYAAASQALYFGEFSRDWLAAGFTDSWGYDDRVLLPVARRMTGPIRGSNPDCGPRSPGSLWSWIQTYHGIQQSSQHLFQQLAQIVQRGGVWQGNIAARLAELGPRPYEFLLCFKPRTGTTGHCVLPYRVEPLADGWSRIWVYDPNFPYDHSLPEDHPANVRSIHSYVDVHPASNNYVFDVDADFDRNNPELVRNHYHAGRRWSGAGLSVTRLPQGTRTMPGLDYGLAYVFASVSGDARPEYSNAAGQRWGWTADGSRVEEIDDVHPYTPYTFAGDESDQITFLTRPQNPWTRVTIRPQGTNYHLVTGGGGVILGLHNRAAVPGSADHAEQRVGPSAPRALRFESAVAHRDLEPFVVLPENPRAPTHHVTWRWLGLALPGGAPVEFDADADTGAIGARNPGALPISARLVRETAGPDGPQATDFGAVTVPPGASVRFTPVGPPDAPRLREEADPDGDGDFERLPDRGPRLAGDPPRLGAVRADAVRKRVRLQILGALRDEVAVERSTDLNRWDTLSTEPAPDEGSSVDGALEPGAAFFRLRRLR